MTKGPILAAVAALMALCAGAAAPADAGPALARVLDAHTQTLMGDGYALAAGPMQGVLSAGAPARLSVRLWAGQDYMFAAACAPRCGGLELRIVAPDGAVLAEAHADAPTLPVLPETTGRHMIEAAAPGCRAQACRLAVNVYAR